MSASCNSGRGLSPLLGTIFNVWLYYIIEWYFIKNEHNRPFKCESVLVWCTKRSTCHDSFSSLDKRQPIPRLQSRCRTLKKCGRRASNCTLANLGIDGWQVVDNSQKKPRTLGTVRGSPRVKLQGSAPSSSCCRKRGAKGSQWQPGTPPTNCAVRTTAMISSMISLDTFGRNMWCAKSYRVLASLFGSYQYM